jgi:hypothetical protein
MVLAGVIHKRKQVGVVGGVTNVWQKLPGGLLLTQFGKYEQYN